ncbi:lipid IV(A) 3-deoxy-D-manno-octulosonic acid transferase [Colwelliaceae bacterium 6441]
MRYSFALIIYRIALLILLPVIILLFIFRSHNHSAYRQRLLERLGFISKSFKQHGIIVHAASVGEVIALTPFIEQLLKSQPETPITFTTFTPTGSAQVKKTFADRVQHCYLPLDVFPSTSLFLSRLKPQAIVLMETELWPNLIAQCHQHHIKLLLVNGRLSDKSMKSYQKLDWLIRPCLQRFDAVLTQSDDNQKNFLSLGAHPNTCKVSGNLKFDLHISPEVELKQQILKEFIKSERPVWLVASTHTGDEALILSSFKRLQKSFPHLLLIIVPRHPERFDSIFQQCQQQGFQTVRRSEKTTVKADDNIWLIDTLGELLATCALADIVTMGGSFSTIGGHNPLEPALFKKAIVVGHDMANFKKVMTQLSLKKGITQLCTTPTTPADDYAATLSITVQALLEDDAKRTLLGENAYQVVHENQGASIRAVNVLKTLLAK